MTKNITIEMNDFEKILQETIDNEPRYYWDPEYRFLMDQGDAEYRQQCAQADANGEEREG